MIPRNQKTKIHQMWAGPKRLNLVMWKVKPTRNTAKKDIMILAGQRTVSLGVLPKRSDGHRDAKMT